jgi:hypothetical protein
MHERTPLPPRYAVKGAAILYVSGMDTTETASWNFVNIQTVHSTVDHVIVLLLLFVHVSL